MSSEWFFKTSSGKEIGPLDSLDIRRFVLEGYIASDTMIRKGGDGRWVLATKVKGLIPSTLQVNSTEKISEQLMNSPIGIGSQTEESEQTTASKHQFLNNHLILLMYGVSLLAIVTIIIVFFPKLTRSAKRSNPAQVSEVGIPDLGDTKPLALDGQAVIDDAERVNVGSAGANRPAPPTAENGRYRIEMTKKYDITELSVTLGRINEKGCRSECILVYEYFNNILPEKIAWDLFEVVIIVDSPIRVERNPFGDLWNRGVIGFGGSGLTIQADNIEFTMVSEFESDKLQSIMRERIRASLTENIVDFLSNSKNATIGAGSKDFMVSFPLDSEARLAFTKMKDRISKKN